MKDKRTKEIIKVGSTAAWASVALAVLEALEGVLVGSVEMVIDGLSHITEAGNAVITVIGAWLGAKPADRKHPFGYGRMEYFSALTIAILTIYAGITGIIGGVETIIHPTHPHYSALSLGIVVISMVVRIVVGRHDVHTGEHYNSKALKLVGRTELRHSILSLATLLAALVYLVFHVQIGSWIAVLISADIFASGILLLKDMMSTLIGERMEADLTKKIRSTILEDSRVHGVHDIVLNNYGPDTHVGSVHIAIDDTLTVTELDKLTRQLTGRVLKECGVYLTGVGIYATNTKDAEIIALRKQVSDIALAHPCVEQVHGFYLDKADKDIRFDIVVENAAKDADTVKDEILKELKAEFPDLSVRISVDTDYGML